MAFRINNRSDYETAYKQSVENPDKFWEEIASATPGNNLGRKYSNLILINRITNGF